MERAYANVSGVVDASTSLEKSQKSYSKWAGEYNEDMKNLKAGLQVGAAEHLMKLSKTNYNGRVLDLATGTGLVGVELRKLGYKGEIDGIDANKELLEIAKQTEVYSKLTQQSISPVTKLDAEYEAYDFVTCIGAFIPHHVPPSSVKQMIPHLKRGGYFLYTTRTTEATASYRQELENHVQSLVDDGCVKFIAKNEIIHFAIPDGKTGNYVTSSIYIYIKC